MATEIVQKIGCGWCITNDHEHCIGYVKNYDTIWVCGCTNDGCGVTSARNTARVGAKPSVQSDEASNAEAVLLEEGKQAGAGVLDAHRDATDQRPTTTRRRRTKKTESKPEQTGS